jgi:hypothetical protein
MAGEGYQESVELEVELTGALTFQFMSGEVVFQVGAGLEVELVVELVSGKSPHTTYRLRRGKESERKK